MRLFKRGIILLALAATSVSACDGEVTEQLAEAMPDAVIPPTFDTGNAQIDEFLVAIETSDRAAVNEAWGGIESLSGASADFTDADSYVERVRECDIEEASPALPGTDPEAVIAVQVVWNCAGRQFRQIIDAEFKAPKIIVTELY